RIAERGVFRRWLLQERQHLATVLNRGIDTRIAPLAVRADENEIFVLAVRCFGSQYCCAGVSLCNAGDRVFYAALAFENVDRRIVTGRRKLTREDDVAVEH